MRKSLTARPDPSLEDKLAFLRCPETYPHPTKSVEVIETHMSWVFLGEQFVYKLKKPVRYDFLDFSTIEARRQDCEREVFLNRRLAPGVYLGTLPLTVQSNGNLQVGGAGKAVDWLVEMRRLPSERMLDVAIREETVTTEDVGRFSQLLADFYGHAAPVHISPARYRHRFEEDIDAIGAELILPRYGLPKAQVESLIGAQQHFLADKGHVLAQRAHDARIVEGHGDLRPQHICLTPEPVIIDCLEFNQEFRILDPVDDLAYLAMECERLGVPAIGEQVLRIYVGVTGDRPPDMLVSFYKAFRACLRAKIAVWHTADHEVRNHNEWLARAREYLNLAKSYIVCW